MLNEHIQVLARKRRNADDYREGLSTLPTKINQSNQLSTLERIPDQTAESDASCTLSPHQTQIQFNENENASTEMEPSAEKKQNTLHRPRWEKSIKPLIDKYALAVEVKPELVFDDYVQPPSTKIIFKIPFEGEFDFKKHYDMLWVRDIYQQL
ncbi:10498_t:CDS:2 [Paraglomus brasilianum]|uniref:10498_t:CDS:1 n=1 Tax=Paraglomus brasilianum TaxID=144538 RepID=A0A9N9BTC1_9GLOM|nr:10498_t:CDS:2 [Paraglomus brasilianum]